MATKKNPPKSTTRSRGGRPVAAARKSTSSRTLSPDKPLTAKQRRELDAAKAARQRGNGKGNGVRTTKTDPAPKLTIEELLKLRVPGVGANTTAKALEIADMPGTVEAPRPLVNRANLLPKEKAGLRGLAAALYVLTGKSDGGVRASRDFHDQQPAAASSRRSKADALEGAAGQKLLLEYLKSEVTGDAELDPLNVPPTIDQDGKLRVRSLHWRAWLAKRGIEVGATAAVKVLREAGLEQERWFSLPRGKRMCYVTTDLPRGTGNLPRREDTPLAGATQPGERRGANPLRRLSDEQAAVVKAALEQYEPPKARAKRAAAEQIVDELLKHLG